MSRMKIKCKSIDDLLGGGVEPGIITMVFGESGTGKTNFCIQASKEYAKEKKVIFIDTEGVSFERIKQICKNDYKKILDNILFFRPNSLEEQEKTIEKIKKIKNKGLIIIDSINLFYRMELDKDKDIVMRSYLRQMGSLQMIARQNNIPVILAGQVYTDKNGEIKPFTHRETDHLVKTIIRLDKIDSGVRNGTIIKHRSEPEGKWCSFKITEKGLE